MLFVFGCKNNEIFSQSKLISIPQRGPDTRLLYRNYREWEKILPFQGLSVAFNPNKLNTLSSSGYFGKGTDELCFSVFKPNKTINFRDYTNAINDLKKCNFKKFTNNFMIISIYDSNWSLWEDDKAWSRMLANLEAASKIAKESGLKGIILDTETYGSPQNLNLTFYCQQFVNKTYVVNSKTAYIQISKALDNHVIDDLFPKIKDKIYWKDSNNVANGIKLENVHFDIYKDNKGNFYYPLLDPKYKNDIQVLLNKVELRGAQIISAISRHFANADIMLTCGPSYVKDVLSDIQGLNSGNNYLRTGYGLLIPLTKGMLNSIVNTNCKLIDGQEQTYYHKTRQQFESSQRNFRAASSYFDDESKSIYLSNLEFAIGLYARPALVNNNPRLFTETEIRTTFKYVSSIAKVKYVWLYEENESYWYLESLKSRYLNKDVKVERIGVKDFRNHLKNIDLNNY